VDIADELVRIAKGEVLNDCWTRQIYSVDASHYVVKPAAVAFPADEQDVQEACRYSSNKKIPITARGAGTGLLGQSLSYGIILDVTRHMNKIIEVGDDYVLVQPGIIKSILDEKLKKKKKFLPPDPASSRYCTIGGMIADNSSGAHCLGYGNTISFLEEVNIVYSDGASGFAGPRMYDNRIDELRKLLLANAGLIKKSYPKVRKNSCGYRLDAVIAKNFNPHKIFAASEGTLGVITSAKFRILDMPLHKCMMVLGFDDILTALSGVPRILKSSPVAIELLDHTISMSQLGKESKSGCLLFIEFAGNGSSTKLERQMKECKDKFEEIASVVEYASDESSMTKIWAARTNALNTIMKLGVGSRRPIGLIEDTVVDPSLLEDHVVNILRFYHENKLSYVMYGHAGDGNLHTRPMIDTSSKRQVELIKDIARKVFADVISKGGTITGEHGDGIARTDYIEMMYGKRMTSLFSKVKKLFDPSFTLNPGKKVLR
jgi:glycolate oxidase